jgi:hypothetical protein
MMNNSSSQLVARSVTFYSEKDEELFSDWIKKIACVKNCYGKDIDIIIDLHNVVSNKSLRDLIGLFYRYNINMSQLSIFETKENKAWFRNPQAYWYESVFMSLQQEISVGVVDVIDPTLLLMGNSGAFEWLAREIEGRWSVKLLNSKTPNSLKYLEIVPSRKRGGNLLNMPCGFVWDMSVNETANISRQLRELASSPIPSHVYLEAENNAEDIKILASKDETRFVYMLEDGDGN